MVRINIEPETYTIFVASPNRILCFEFWCDNFRLVLILEKAYLYKISVLINLKSQLEKALPVMTVNIDSINDKIYIEF